MHEVSGLNRAFWAGNMEYLAFAWVKNGKWVWSGNTTITNRRQPHSTARKSHSIITRLWIGLGQSKDTRFKWFKSLLISRHLTIWNSFRSTCPEYQLKWCTSLARRRFQPGRRWLAKLLCCSIPQLWHGGRVGGGGGRLLLIFLAT